MNEIVGDIPLYIKADGIWSVPLVKCKFLYCCELLSFILACHGTLWSQSSHGILVSARRDNLYNSTSIC
ncbi:hypothetical protein GDO81_000004 [Engystomops pustulosus]|uniref:Uncharacterized protein n=1 Tax=Engystomops pustulosus TaxID=76066 RepID=A0AAV7D1M4_ENGPU|nr:hypothetical protein GDO81_000004 [Engystomops pustulosus]